MSIELLYVAAVMSFIGYMILWHKRAQKDDGSLMYLACHVSAMLLIAGGGICLGLAILSPVSAVDGGGIDFRNDGLSDDTFSYCVEKFDTIPEEWLVGLRVVVFDDKVIHNNKGQQVLAYHVPGIILFHLGCRDRVIAHELAHQAQWNNGYWLRRHNGVFYEYMEVIYCDMRGGVSYEGAC